MSIPEPFTLTAISAGMITNLAADILKHRSQYVQQPFIVRVLKWAGWREPDLTERIQGVLVKALTIYFDTFPPYRMQGIVEFFKHPTTTQKIAAYVLVLQL